MVMHSPARSERGSFYCSPYMRNTLRELLGQLLMLLCVTLSGTVCAEERLSITALTSCNQHDPVRAGGEISIETDHFIIKNLTAGITTLLPVSRGQDPFEVVPGLPGFEGLYLGLRHRFGQDTITPFVGVNALGHLLAETPYASLNPEAGLAIRFLKQYEFSVQLRYSLTTRSRENDFLTVGLGLSRLF